METQVEEIPVLKKSKVVASESHTSCCSDSTSCCTPSRSAEENEGACCAQPEDGSACCDK